jgi:NADH:ubiquinone oxidoreductase subunit 6 (subunit J)
MCPLLLAESAEFRERLVELWPIAVPVVLGLVAVYLLLPRARSFPPLWGSLFAALALISGGFVLTRAKVAHPETILFYAFSLIAILSGGLLITQRNPVRAALSFALVVLSTCGLFLLQAAPFLMAATTIVYAGAIVVTFLFVIMLAQQAGQSDADHRSREPELSCFAGFLLLGALLFLLRLTYDTTPLDALLGRVDQGFAAVDGLVSRAGPGAPNPPTVQEVQAELRRTDWDSLFKTLREEVQEHGGMGGEFEDEEREAANPEKERNPRDQFARDVLEAQSSWNGLEGALERESTPPDNAAAARPLGAAGRLALAEFGRWLARLRDDAPAFRETYGQLPAAAATRTPLRADNVALLGQSLFTNFLIPVELGGTLLLVATIGAIAIAGRRGEGLR